MYLSEYERIKLRSPIEEKLFKNPCIEKTLKVLLELDMFVNLSSKFEKQIDELNKFSPIERMAKDMLEFKSNKKLQIS